MSAISKRLRISIGGAVQGVGFRPFVHRLASELQLSGWVRNSGTGVFCEVEGAAVERFLERLEREGPGNAVITGIESDEISTCGGADFEILPSESEGALEAQVMPDLATCPECLREILDPANRRYRYPFTNCTRCGPRFSILERIPYDRPNTTMRGFTMCPACEAEYRDPADRRFHAQPNACPECGPQIWLTDGGGRRLSERDDALREAVAALRDGMILAVKGIGGFHLLTPSINAEAVRRLRERKRRGDKPFAVMYPSLALVRRDCEVSDVEARLLESAAAPIVLLHRWTHSGVCHAVAPGNPDLGVLLPYSPLHHLLLRELGEPVVATSGNLSDEPICFENDEALVRLGKIADRFLMHDRPIRRPVDDSVACEVAGREMVLRRSRGYAPLPLPLAGESSEATLAVGTDLKNTVAWARGGQVWLSQHLGDLGTEPSLEAHSRMLEDLPALYPGDVGCVAHDLHPDYHSTRQAQGIAQAHSLAVQHHHAHILACMAEHGLQGECLGVAWDGTGYGTDGTIWGGEFLLINKGGFERHNWLRPFPLPGGEKAVREPRFTALGLLHEAGLSAEGLAVEDAFEESELALTRSMLEREVNCPRTSSMGRLFDGLAAVLGLRFKNRFEGEAAMSLEFAARGWVDDFMYPVHSACPIDWAPMLAALRVDLLAGCEVGLMAARFHRWLVEMLIDVARRAGQKTVVLSGGCFQNRALLEMAVARLRDEAFDVYWPRQVPPNDGGIALGQAVAAARLKR